MAETRNSRLDPGADVTIRRAVAADAVALRRLAALDEKPPLTGAVLVAEVAGELWAAAGLADDRTIADPFRPTLGVRELLALRRRKLVEPDAARRRFRLLRQRFAA